MVLIFSSSANASMQIEREVERAVHKGVHIIPLRVEDTVPTKTLEYFISAPHWLDAMSTPLEQHIGRLAAAVKVLLGKPGQHAGPVGEVPAGLPASLPSALTVSEVSEVGAASVPRTDAVGAASPASSRTGLVAAALAIGALVVGGALFFGRRPPPSAVPEAQPAASAAQTSQAGASVPPVTDGVAPQGGSAPTGASASTQANTPASASPAAATSSTSAVIPAATRSTRAANKSAATPAAAKAGTQRSVPNLLVDFVNTVDEGMISLDVDGRRVWFALLGKGVKEASPKDGAASKAITTARPGAPEGPLSASRALPQSAHEAIVTLLNEDGKARDTKTLNLQLANQAEPQTLQIRLSRFRKDLQLKLVDAQAAKSAGSP